MMRKLFARIAGLFKSNGNGNENTDPGVGEEVTRQNVDHHTDRIQAKAVMARLQLQDVERKLKPPECQET